MNTDLLVLAGFLAVSCPAALIAGGIAEARCRRNRVADDTPMPVRAPEPQPELVTATAVRLDLPEAA